jgi:hypothetical protein
VGINYELNREFDLYFNLFYEGIEEALRLKPKTIFFGQNGGKVKLRLGCQPSRRTLFIQGHRLWHPLIKTFSSFLFPQDELGPSLVEPERSAGPEDVAPATAPAAQQTTGQVAAKR